MRHVLLSLIHTFTLRWLPISTLAQESPCDSSLVQPKGDPYGYRARGDRCEGIYIKEVGGTPLFIASFTESFEDYDLASDKNLLVEWTAPANRAVQLQANGLRYKLYYRMDTKHHPGAKSYAWPLNLLATLKIMRRDLGIVGWMQYPVGKMKKVVYVPLRISQQKSALHKNNYALVLLPGRELSGVFLTVALVDANGNPKDFIADEKPLDLCPPCPAERPINIPIANLPRLASIMF